MEDRILTLHPGGKQGVNISREKYEVVEEAILSCLTESGELTFNQLAEAVEEMLSDRFDGSIRWYYTTVKLDLEARNIVERTSTRPQLIRIVPDG